MPRFKQVTAPSVFPVSLDELKYQANIETSFTTDDVLLEALINVATDRVEQMTNRRLVNSTWNLYLGDFPIGNFICMPFGKLNSITHLKYKDSGGTQSTWASSNYIAETDTEPGRLVYTFGNTWPGDALYPSNPIEIQFVSGYYHSNTKWTANTPYAEGDLILPLAIENGMVFECTTAGTSTLATEPTWDLTIGNTTADNTAVWTCKGETIPRPIRQAVLILANDYYQHREEEVIGTITSSVDSIAVSSLLQPYVLYGYNEELQP